MYVRSMGDLTPGFRFYPTEEELISFYLKNKLEGSLEEVIDLVIPVLNVYDFNPSHLSQYSGAKCRGDTEQSFFFIPQQESEVRGGRPSRLTETGYWKATGSPSSIYSLSNRIIGQKRTMVFYVGRAPQGQKTQWKMNEYKAIQGEAISSTIATPPLRQEFSLCRVYKKTKCLRAFDRRPTGAGNNITVKENPSNNQNISGDHHDRREAEASTSATTYHHHHPIASQDRSLHDGVGGPSMTTESDDQGMQIAAEDAFDMIFWDNL